MLAMSLTPPPDSRVLFCYSAVRKCPEESGCYALTTGGGAILYIGQARNIAKRMEQHLADDEKRARTSWLYYKFWPANDLDGLERGWMNEYKLKERGERPLINKVDAPI